MKMRTSIHRGKERIEIGYIEAKTLLRSRRCLEMSV
jgi:hypothetical protein